MSSTISQIITGIKHKFAGSPDAAVRAILKEAEKNRELHDKLLELGAQQILRASLAASRRVGAEESEEIILPSTIREQAKLQFMERYTLFGGAILLAEATKKDLDDSARMHDSQAAGHELAAAFEREVASRLPSGKRVRDVFKDEKLIELHRDPASGKTRGEKAA